MSNSVMAILFGLAALGVLYIWSSGAKAGRAAERRVREITRVGAVLLTALVSAAVITGLQWVVLTRTAEPVAIGLVLGIPALLAGVTIGRLFAVTTVVRTVRVKRGVRR